MASIEVTNLHPYLSFEEHRVHEFFKRLISHYDWDAKGVLSLAFLPEKDHSKLHGQFLNDYRPTDVITFPADPDNEIAGEICVSVEQAMEISLTENFTFDQELSLYLIHGLLHLIGYDDKSPDDRKLMKQEESVAMEIIDKDDLWPKFLLASSHSAD